MEDQKKSELTGKYGKNPDYRLRTAPNGDYQMRFSYAPRPEITSTRITINLETRRPEEARARRDIVLKALDVCEKIKKYPPFP